MLVNREIIAPHLVVCRPRIIVPFIPQLLVTDFWKLQINIFLRNRRKGESRQPADAEVKENEIYEMNGPRKEGICDRSRDENTVNFSENKSDTNNMNPPAIDATYSSIHQR